MRFSGVALCTLSAISVSNLPGGAVETLEPSLPEGAQTEASRLNQRQLPAPVQTTQLIAAPERVLDSASASLQPALSSWPLSENSPTAHPAASPATSGPRATDPGLSLEQFIDARATTSAVALTTLEPGTPGPENRADAKESLHLETVADAMPASSQPCLQIAQATGTQGCPRPEPVQPLVLPEITTQEASPALSIYIPVGYGADRNTVWISGTYQSDVRVDDFDAAAFGVGMGLGDADRAIGAELSYAFANNPNFGEGGFNAKLHRRFAGDVGLALGWNGFVNIGRNDFEHSFYGAATKVFRLKDSLDDAFSRLSLTVGLGNNQFRSNGAIDAGIDNVNVFGNLALRVVRPVSLIAEWTGQDLALGLSIAPFRNFPLVITPAVRDVVTSQDRVPRFVLGAGLSFSF